MLKLSGKIPLEIQPFFWLIASILGWINTNTIQGTLIWISVVFIGVLVHEYGHALTAVAFGQNAKIELSGLGGLTTRRGPILKRWQEIAVIIAGPLTGLLLAAIAFLVHSKINQESMPIFSYWLVVTFVANLFWTIVNLLPVHPLDGGRLLTVILEGLFGFRGVKISLFISTLSALLLTVLFFLMHQIFAGALFFLWTIESYRAWKNAADVQMPDQDSDLQKLFREGEEDLKYHRDDEARQKFEKVREQTKAGVIYLAATEYLALLLNRQGNSEEAYQMLLSINHQLSPKIRTQLHQLMYRNKDWKTVNVLGNRAYQESPSYEIALINSMCYAQLGEIKPAIGWLQCAINDGMPNVRAILSKTEFDPIRSEPSFRQLAEKSI